MEALSIEGAWVFTPRIFADNRGFFHEAYRAGEFTDDLGYALDLRQVNCSVSSRGVVRGIHFTAVPPGQAKTRPTGARCSSSTASVTPSWR
jgi:dTDP-4-dehydrorhamnose 3,5-epimerase